MDKQELNQINSLKKGLKNNENTSHSTEKNSSSHSINIWYKSNDLAHNSTKRSNFDTLYQAAKNALEKEPSNPCDPLIIKNYGLLDIIEEDDKTVFFVDAPGLKKEDIEITVADNRLNINATRVPEYGPDEVSIYSERYYNTVKQNIMLPVNSDINNISSTYSDGVICVKIGKTKSDSNKIIKKIPVLYLVFKKHTLLFWIE